jgi:cytochrome c biogenesis protein CcmG/thiol:disulfide interchange protein DsbE
MSGPEAHARRSRLLLLVPLVLFAALAALLFLRLGAGDPSRLPSALIGKPAPALELPALEGAGVLTFTPPEFAGRVTVVNVWASWCGPCRDEHPFLVRLAADKRIRVVGINYKDTPQNARSFLSRYGNPFAAIGVDSDGRAAIEWGVYGVPETFIVGRDGRIAHKHVGPIDEQSLRGLIQPAIEKALLPSPGVSGEER